MLINTMTILKDSQTNECFSSNWTSDRNFELLKMSQFWWRQKIYMNSLSKYMKDTNHQSKHYLKERARYRWKLKFHTALMKAFDKKVTNN